MKKRVLFICRNNSGRSQMAEGILRNMYGEHYHVQSAGSQPREINPLTVRVMEEIGIDMSSHKPTDLRELEGEEFDVVVSLCDEACPVFPGGKRFMHAEFPDPAGGDIARFRRIRDEISEWIRTEFKPEDD